MELGSARCTNRVLREKTNHARTTPRGLLRLSLLPDQGDLFDLANRGNHPRHGPHTATFRRTAHATPRAIPPTATCRAVSEENRRSASERPWTKSAFGTEVAANMGHVEALYATI